MKCTMALLAAAALFLGMATGVALADKPAPVEVPVPYTTGTYLKTDDGLLEWLVPANAHTDNFTIRYTPLTRADFPTQPVNSIWAAEPFNIDMIYEGNSIPALVPMTLTVHYDPAEFGGRSESTLRIVRNGAGGSVWVDLPSTVDTARRTVTARASLWGDYGLAVSNVFQAVPAPTATPVPAPTAAPAAPPAPASAPAAPPAFRLGFATLASLIPDVVGQPLEDEHHNPINRDSLQRTTTGLMVWRKADNWTAFTNGSRTWVNGPFGLQERGNEERFDWEG